MLNLIILSSFLFFQWANAIEAVGSGELEETVTTNHQLCEEFLQRTQRGLFFSLQEKKSKFQKTLYCLSQSTHSCHSLQNKILQDLHIFENYKAVLFNMDISYNPLHRDFESVGTLNNTLRNRLRKPIANLPKKQRKHLWSEFETSYRNYLQTHFQERKRAITQPSSPLWKKCFHFKDGEIALQRWQDHHFWTPHFRRNVHRTDRKECQNLKEFWLKKELPTNFIRNYRKKNKIKKRALEEKLKPWMYFIEQDTKNVSREQKLKAVAEGLQSLIIEYDKIISKVTSLGRNDRHQLLAFKSLMNKMGSQAFCKKEDEQKSSWPSFLKKLGLSLVPGHDLYQSLFVEGPENDTNFLVGFINHKEWRKKNTSIDQTNLSTGMHFLPQAAIESAVVGKVMKSMGKIMKRSANNPFVYFFKKDLDSAVNKVHPYATYPAKKIKDLFRTARNEKLNLKEQRLLNSRVKSRQKLIGEKSGSSSAYLVTLNNGAKGIFKPCVQTTKVVDCAAEVLAYQVDKKLGLNLVPPTILRKINMNGIPQNGSLQKYIPGTTIYRHKTPNSKDLDKQSFFDYLINNGDRHGENFLVSKKDGRVTSIDHGLSFKRKGRNFKPYVRRKLEIQRFLNTREGQIALEKVKAMDNMETQAWLEEYLGREHAVRMMMRIRYILRTQSGNIQ